MEPATAQASGGAADNSAAGQTLTRKLLIEASNVEKSYGATRVLRGVNLHVRAGEIHALLGGNGAGKSTLIRIITGLTPRDAGDIALASAKAGRGSPIIAVVHQELALLPELSVAENIGIVHAKSGLSHSSSRRMREIALAALRLIDPAIAEAIVDLSARKLSLHEGQIAEIARALSTGAEVLLLDEPTANLTAGETAKLFSVLKRLVRDEGIGIVFVSHRMKEIRELCDVCTILRDGVTVANATPLASLSDAAIVQHMGQPAQRSARRPNLHKHARGGAPTLLLGPDDARIETWSGMILGLAGAPAGPTGLIDPLVGAGSGAGWHVSNNGVDERFSSPLAAARAGIGFVSGDRATKGILSQLPIADNVLAARRIRERRRIVGAAERQECCDLVSALKLKADSIWDLPASLSGGNQQKLLVARWLDLPLRMVVLEEPTRGVDIGTKHDIYRLIREMADAGAIIIWWSTENVELLELCDAIFAFDTDGRPKGFLPEERFTEDGLAELTGMAA
ncbi:MULTISPECIES: sugar ABC transporter ATP-binding protein [unclassified Mesorhizobium]|uniref:ATP-binding cassette domain-containing protein n=1 Tax=unclassified Mesorhizobium TaxID=325217 RepID=UPI000FC9ACF8|nr:MULTISPECIES: sugar ABC transporter ATP-binding protein [unclassified Mesorhizobium]RUV17093.1 sugar ABC transporter ATP-binding protein [Mesorhizobium sp. M1A.F.Ca.IN.022.04.1.1]RWG30027.1 MAG: sugar ABC transporter ATP-binding protein [Mesorhizobium sp.]